MKKFLNALIIFVREYRNIINEKVVLNRELNLKKKTRSELNYIT